MRKFRVFLLFLLVVVSVRGQSEETPQDAAAVCYNDFQTKMSSTTALRYTVKFTDNEIKELQLSLNETQDILKKAKRRKAEIHALLVEKKELFQALAILLQNLTTEAQELHSTCDSVLANDCCQIKTVFPIAKNGIYEIKDPCSADNAFNFAKIHVRCNMETDGGGWIVIQRRIANGTINFYRNWEDYENGFGDLEGEFWIGLKNMHELTKQPVNLRVTLWNNDEDAVTWNYPTFRVDSPGTNYRLTISGGIGNGGTDGLAYSNGHQFSTFNREYDGYSRRNCASYHQGGWWHYGSTCTRANLNGRHASSRSWERLFWGTPGNTFANSEMKIRSKTCVIGG